MIPIPRRSILSLLFATTLLVAVDASAQTVLTEDFEAPDTLDFTTFIAGQQMVTNTNTWDITQASIDLFEDALRPEAVAFDGGQAVDLAGTPGPGIMETTFPTVPGASYELVFYYARNNFLGIEPGDAQIDVLGTGTLLTETIIHDPAQIGFNVHVEFRESFIADGSQATLRLTSLDNSSTGITVDAISITGPVPAVPGLVPAGGIALVVASILTGIRAAHRRRAE